MQVFVCLCFFFSRILEICDIDFTATTTFLNDRIFAFYFSNSFIIHQEKTKKITTVTVVWICDPNYHKILPTLALNFSKNY